ncbi:MAG TPA: PadR family transcriptional regulator [Solirubrobacteraceae bacterium]|nr:PadR family transcriptional regulator [Solirubrobacteraceae bacterium]
MQAIKLTPTSYIVLGLLDVVGEATPYDLKQMVAGGVGNLWSLQHAQLYSEPERLTKAGYLSERRERGGRRRKHYSLTDQGRRALAAWVAEPTSEFTQLRDVGLLKLFLGADPATVAAAQLELHSGKLAEYERAQNTLAAGEGPPGPRLALEAGIGHEREYVRFWSRFVP